MNTPIARAEPDDRWKGELRRRIDNNLDQLLLDAKQTYDGKVRATLPHEDITRRRLYVEYLQTGEDLKRLARDEYNYAIERERQEMQWFMEAEAEVPPVDESLRAQQEEQYEMLNAYHQELARVQAKPEAVVSNPYETSFGEEERHAPRLPAEHDLSEPGTPVVASLTLDERIQDEEYRAHAAELSRLLSDTPPPVNPKSDTSFFPILPESPLLSPPRSPSPSPRPLAGLELSPSPPSTPGLSSEEEAEGADLSSAESSVICTPQLSFIDEELRLRQEAEAAMFFTPQRSVVDEEIRLRAERKAEQQEEFRRRAEEIKRRNEEKKKQKQGGGGGSLQISKQSFSKTRVATADSAPPSEPSSPYSSYTHTPTGSFPSSSLFSSSCTSSASSSPMPFRPRMVLASPPQSLPPSRALSPRSPSPRGWKTSKADPISQEDMLRIFIFHDQQWARITAFAHLSWSDFPWPTLSFSETRGPADITYKSVSTYILSGADWTSPHQRDKSRQIVKDHLGRWAPERFQMMYLGKVGEAGGEREMVRVGAGLVVRYLNEVLAAI